MFLSVSSLGVPVNPMNEALGAASRTCRAKPSIKSYWLRCGGKDAGSGQARSRAIGRRMLRGRFRVYARASPGRSRARTRARRGPALRRLSASGSSAQRGAVERVRTESRLCRTRLDVPGVILAVRGAPTARTAGGCTYVPATADDWRWFRHSDRPTRRGRSSGCRRRSPPWRGPLLIADGRPRSGRPCESG